MVGFPKVEGWDGAMGDFDGEIAVFEDVRFSGVAEHVLVVAWNDIFKLALLKSVSVFNKRLLKMVSGVC